MKERPILMTPDNAQKCFEGTKTQTRRLIKPQPADSAIIPAEWSKVLQRRKMRDIYGGDGLTWGNVPIADGTWGELRCPYGTTGDRLWVREAFCVTSSDEGTSGLLYRGQCEEYPSLKTIWKPSIHMPRWACRTVLEITEVRVERVQEISETDCCLEGCGSRITRDRKRPRFMALWESLNGPGSWERNDWVWVLSFRRVKQ